MESMHYAWWPCHSDTATLPRQVVYQLPDRVSHILYHTTNPPFLFSRWVRRYLKGRGPANRYAGSRPSLAYNYYGGPTDFLRYVLCSRAGTWEGLRRAFRTNYLSRIRSPWEKPTVEKQVWWPVVVSLMERAEVLRYTTTSETFGRSRPDTSRIREVWRQAWREARILRRTTNTVNQGERWLRLSQFSDSSQERIRDACRPAITNVFADLFLIARGNDFAPFMSWFPGWASPTQYRLGLVGERWLLRKLGLPPGSFDVILAADEVHG